MGVRRDPQDTVWLKVNTRPYFEAGNDSANGVIISFSDITDRKRAEDEFRNSEEHLAATLRSIGDGVIVCDREGKFTSLNSAAKTFTGWGSAEAARHPLEEVFHIINAQSREAAENPVARTLKDGVNVDLVNHTALIAKDGTEHQIAGSCAPIRDASGVVTGAVLVFRDMTETYRQRIRCTAVL